MLLRLIRTMRGNKHTAVKHYTATEVGDFDAEFYLNKYKDVAEAGVDPLKHYLDHGRNEGRQISATSQNSMDPNSAEESFVEDATITSQSSSVDNVEGFDAKFYIDTYQDVAAAGVDPLRHYLDHGQIEGRRISATAKHIVSAREDLTADGVREILNIIYPSKEIFRPGLQYGILAKMFSPEYYRTTMKLDSKLTRVQLFGHFMVSGLPLGASPGPLFDRTHYLNSIEYRGVKFESQSLEAFEHWLTYGIANNISPTPFYSDEAYLWWNKDLADWPGPLFDHFLSHGLQEGRQFSRGFTFAQKATATLCDENKTGSQTFFSWIGNLSDSTKLKREMSRFNEFMESPRAALAFKEANLLEPAIGGQNKYKRASLVPPWHDSEYLDYCSVREMLPQGKFDNVILMPFCKLGGADYVAGLLARSLIGNGSTLILRTDQSDWARPDWFPDNVFCIDLSAHLNQVSEHLAVRFLYELVREVDAINLINVNSYKGFLLLERFGKQLRYNVRLHAYFFCSDRDEDDMEVGYPVRFFPNIINNLTSALIDNEALKSQLCQRFALVKTVSTKLHTIYTPAMTEISEFQLRDVNYPPSVIPRRPLLIWAGRLDKQKRFDLVVKIAHSMPEVDFECWGKAVLDSPPDIRTLPSNLNLHPPYISLQELPISIANGWLYTSEWDGLPTILIECAAIGMPVVASAVGGVPELIDHETGWLVDDFQDADAYVEKVREMLSDSEEANQRALALRARALERHKFSIYREQILKIMEGGFND